MSLRKRSRTKSTADLKPLDGVQLQPSSNRREWQGRTHVDVEVASFLKACGLCKRSFRPGKDIYMYKGEVAFCSVACRDQRIKDDECEQGRSVSTAETVETPPSNSGNETSSSNTTDSVSFN